MCVSPNKVQFYVSTAIFCILAVNAKIIIKKIYKKERERERERLRGNWIGREGREGEKEGENK